MANDTEIANNQVVTFHYTLTNDKGEILDSSRDSEPMAYLQGGGNIVPGLERKMLGHKVGDKFEVVVAPADGYGDKIGNGPRPVPRDTFEDSEGIEEGMPVMAQGPDGESFTLWVVKVEEHQIWMDANHPLAGETLHFAVEIVAIRNATKQELAHGHPHGPGGAHH